MMRNRQSLQRWIIMGVLAFSIAVAGSAQADAISFSTSFDLANSYQGPTGRLLQVLLNDSDFATILGTSPEGTLQSVDVSFSSIYNVFLDDVSAIDESPELISLPPPPFPQSPIYTNSTFVSAHVSTQLGVALLLPPGVTQTFPTGIFAECLDSYVESRTPDGTACDDSNQMSGDFSGSLPLGSIPLSSLVGIWPFQFQFTMDGALDATCDDDDGDFCDIGNAGISWSGNVTVTYTYLPVASVPEPGSLVLLGAGLFGLGLVRRHLL